MKLCFSNRILEISWISPDNIHAWCYNVSVKIIWDTLPSGNGKNRDRGGGRRAEALLSLKPRQRLSLGERRVSTVPPTVLISLPKACNAGDLSGRSHQLKFFWGASRYSGFLIYVFEAAEIIPQIFFMFQVAFASYALIASRFRFCTSILHQRLPWISILFPDSSLRAQLLYNTQKLQLPPKIDLEYFFIRSLYAQAPRLVKFYLVSV